MAGGVTQNNDNDNSGCVNGSSGTCYDVNSNCLFIENNEIGLNTSAQTIINSGSSLNQLFIQNGSSLGCNLDNNYKCILNMTLMTISSSSSFEPVLNETAGVYYEINSISITIDKGYLFLKLTTFMTFYYKLE